MKKEYQINNADQGILLVAGRLFSYALQVGATIVLARLLTQDELGLYQQVILVSNVIITFISFGLDSSPYVFLPRLDPKDKKSFLVQTWIVQGVGGIGAALVMYFGADLLAGWFGDPRLATYIKIISLLPLFGTFQTSFYSILISLFKPIWAAVLMPLSALLQPIAAALAFWLGASLEQVLLLISTLAAVKFLVISWVSMRDYRDEKYIWNPELLRDQLRFSLPLYVGQTVERNGKYLDQIIVSLFFDTSTYAVYAVGTMRLPFIALLARPVIDSIRAQVSRYWAEGEIGKLVRTWHNAVRRNALLIFPVTCLVFILAEPTILFLYSEKYLESVLPFQIYLLSLPAQIVMTWAILSSMGKSRIIALVQIGSVLLSLPLELVLVKSVGLIGPAIGYSVFFYLRTSVYLTQARRHFNLKVNNLLPWRALAMTAFAALLSGFIIIPINNIHASSIITLGLGGVIYLGVYVLLCWFLGLITESDKNHFKRWLDMARSFLPSARER